MLLLMHAVLLRSQVEAALHVRFLLRVHTSLRVRVGTGSFSQTLSTFTGAVAGHGPRVHARQLGNHNCQVITSAWHAHASVCTSPSLGDVHTDA